MRVSRAGAEDNALQVFCNLHPVELGKRDVDSVSVGDVVESVLGAHNTLVVLGLRVVVDQFCFVVRVVPTDC